MSAVRDLRFPFPIMPWDIDFCMQNRSGIQGENGLNSIVIKLVCSKIKEVIILYLNWLNWLQCMIICWALFSHNVCTSQYPVALWENATFVAFSLQVRSNVFECTFECTYEYVWTYVNMLECTCKYIWTYLPISLFLLHIGSSTLLYWALSKSHHLNESTFFHWEANNCGCWRN